MKKVCVILGNYDGTRGLFDFSRTDCDIWAFNEMLSQSNPDNKWVIRADAIFQLHAEPIWRNPANRTDPGHFEWLRTQTSVPVYMQEQYPDVPMSVKFPLDEIITFRLANFNIKNVFSSTASYCMALAIHLGYEQIETYGIELGTESEYFHQREGFTFWVGYALGAGIRTTVYTDALLKAPLYGYEGEVTLPYEVFVNRMLEITPETDRCLAAYDEQQKITSASINAIREELNQDTLTALINNINELSRVAVTYAIQEGGRQENERYIKKADAMREASGGEFIFSRQEFESARVAEMGEHAKLILSAQSETTRCAAMVELISRTPHRRKRLKYIAQLGKMINSYIHINVAAGMMAGGIAENHAYLARLDAGIRAAGGERSVSALLSASRKTVESIESAIETVKSLDGIMERLDRLT